MNKQDFLTKLAEMLETDTAFTGQETLATLPEWDSLAVLSFMALADSEAGKTLSVQDIGAAKTVDDLYGLVAA
jgi:acyl carrier protein